jgi:hypothetical protein
MADHRRKSLGAETTFARDLLAWEEVATALEPVFAKMWAAYSRPQSPGLTDARPMQVVDPAARYHHELRLPGVGNGPPKPIRRRRTDRKEIGWYGFAAHGGCTRITGWVLPLIGQHYIGRRTLLIS